MGALMDQKALLQIVAFAAAGVGADVLLDLLVRLHVVVQMALGMERFRTFLASIIFLILLLR